MCKLSDFQAIDLFCGVGGLSYGMKQHGMNIAAGIDFDAACGYAFQENVQAKFVHQDITTVEATLLNELYASDKRRILLGCAPCQPFSNHSNKLKNKKNIAETDNRWTLLDEFRRLIIAAQPEIISMENVPQLTKHSVFHEFIAALKEQNYYISDYRKPIYCPDYGVPQRRKRLVLLASKLGQIEIIAPTHKKQNYVTVKAVIGDLPPIQDGETHPKDALHRARKLSPLNLKRIQALKEGQTWTSFKDDTLIAPCHKSETGNAFTAVYGRMCWNETAPTITTHCIGLSNGRFGHPSQDRAISLREAALLQSFPKTYRFVSDSHTLPLATLARHIGNAVPPKLGEAIAKSIQQHIEKFTILNG
jgi:DNA (cytosine-5)-methyltransferase 1